MRWPAATALGIVAYLLFLLYSLPAQHVVGWFEESASAQGLSLTDITGTVWSGSAERISYQRTPLGRLEWDFKPSRLLLGKLAYDIELRDTGQQLQATFLTGLGEGYSLHGIDAQWLASRLPEGLLQRGVRIDGKLSTTLLDLEFSQRRENRLKFKQNLMFAVDRFTKEW